MNCKVIIIASEFVFIELANAISQSLNEIGYNSSVTTNENDLSDINIIIKAFRQFNTNNGHKNILFQMEELWNRREKGIYDLSNGYDRVLELYEDNTKIPIGTNNVVFCPIGYSSAFEFDLPKVKEDIDVFFYGSLTDRRKNIINELNKSNFTVLGETEIFGINRNKKIMRSKIIINIKAHDKWFYGPLHCLIAQCNKKLMICEKVNGGHGPFIPNKHYIEFTDIKDGKSKIEYYLKNENERNEFAINAYNDIKKNINFTKYIKDSMKGM